MKITLAQSKNFAMLSNDKNKIHINKIYAEKFFLKKTICHGANLAILMLKNYFKKNPNRLDGLEIFFFNPVYTNEKFKIISKKKTIYLNSIKQKKIKINILRRNNSKIISKKKIYNLLKKVSNKVGNFSKLPTLITKININFIQKKNKILNISNNVYRYFISNNELSSDTIFIKLQEKEKINLTKKKVKFKNKKKVLIFGKNSDLGLYTSKYLMNEGFKVEFFKGNYFFKKKLKNDFFSLSKILLKNKYDYIFYYLSPKIEKNKKINYNFLYIEVFLKILSIINGSKTKIFYPSTKYIGTKEKEFKFYINSKKNAEKKIKKKDANNQVVVIRLPRYKTSQTYSLFQGYEGESINKFGKILKKFIK